MCVLILGGDRIKPIIKTLDNLGVDKILHWTGRKQKNGRKKAKKIPTKVDMLIILTNFLNHNAMLHYKAEAKVRGLKIIYSSRHINSVKNEFEKAL